MFSLINDIYGFAVHPRPRIIQEIATKKAYADSIENQPDPRCDGSKDG
jgi:hypothetical protein